MNQQDLIAAIQRQGQGKHDKKQAEAMLNTICAVLIAALSDGETVTLPGIGRLGTVTRKAMTCRSPENGKTIHITEKRTARFTPIPSLKDALNGGRRDV